MKTTAIRYDNYRATLADADDGVAVALYEEARTDGDRPVARLVHSIILDVPFHVALDEVHAMLRRLPAPLGVRS